MALTVRHKRGDTFQYEATLRDGSGVAISLAGWTIKSQVRDRDGDLLSAAVVTVTNAAAGEYQVVIADTRHWPIRAVNWDIEYKDSSNVVRSTETITVNVIQDVTERDN
jgi:hypothetical protein